MSEKEIIDKYMGRRTIAYRLLECILLPLSLILYRLKVINWKAIPEKGAAILAGNHRFLADPVFVCCCTKRVVHYLAKEEIFHWPVIGWIFNFILAIPVYPKGIKHRSTAMAEAVLNEGKLIGIFPEGIRNKTDADLLPFRTGAVRMAADTGAPIIPLAMKGGIIPFFQPVTIIFGEPYHIDKDADFAEESRRLQNKVLELMNSAA